MKKTPATIVALLIFLPFLGIYFKERITNEASDQAIPNPTSQPDNAEDYRSPKILTNKLLKKAAVAIKSTNLDDAKTIYEEILKAEPENKDALYGMGVLYTKYADYEKATEYLHEALRVDPSLINKAIDNPDLADLRTNSAFHNLLRIENESIPEMHSQMRQAPMAPE